MHAFLASGFRSPYYEDRHLALARQVYTLGEQLTAERRSAGLDAAGAIRFYVRALASNGLLEGLIRPVGESGRPDLRAIGVVRDVLSYLDDLADCAFSIQGLGMSPIAFHGSEALKERFLAPALRGERLGAFAITEPAGGSNSAEVGLQAEARGDTYVLNGRKVFISQAGLADHYCVFASTNPTLGSMGVSCFVVLADTPGLQVEPSVAPAGSRLIGALQFNNCEVPRDHLVGKAGHGYRYAMEIIEMYRVSLASAANGASERALRGAIDWSNERKVGSERLRDQQLIKAKLADMALALDASRLLATHAAWLYDTRAPQFSRYASAAKLFATESACRVVDEAIQIHGAQAVIDDSPLQALYRQVRSTRIYEGTSEMQKFVIADSLR